MPYRVYTASDGTQIHKFERAPPGSQAAGKPIVSNTKMSLEDVFDKTKARPLKELMAENKAKKAAAERYVSPDKYHTLVNYDWKVQEMKSAYPNGVMVSRLPNGYDTWRAAESKPEAAKEVPKHKLPLVRTLTDAENAYLIKYMKYTPTDAVMVLKDDMSRASPSTLKAYRKFYSPFGVALSLPYDTTYIYHDKTNKQLSAEGEPRNPIY